MMVTVHAGRPGLVVAKDGRVRIVHSPGQLRLLLALVEHGGTLPVRRATRVIWPNQDGPLQPSQRSSAARSVSRLRARGFVEQRQIGEPPGAEASCPVPHSTREVWVDCVERRVRDLAADRRELIAAIRAAWEQPAGQHALALTVGWNGLRSRWVRPSSSPSGWCSHRSDRRKPQVMWRVPLP
jgi:hypothetical protein